MPLYGWVLIIAAIYLVFFAVVGSLIYKFVNEEDFG